MGQSKFTFNKSIPLLAAVVILLLSVFLINDSALHHTNGVFTYPLDDTYIHMAVAKNLAFHNNWGINSHDFGSASSSILYTLLLALSFKIFSLQVTIPLIINLIVGIVLLIVIQRILQKENIGAGGQFLMLLSVIFFTPLPILIISGMEHTLQCLFSLLFIYSFSKWIERSGNSDKKSVLPWQIVIYGTLVCTVRYEGMFLVAIACIILLFNKRIASAFKLGLISLLPIIIFGIYSVSKGSYFLPNSVLLKSDGLTFSLNGITRFISNIFIERLTVSKTGITALATQRLLIILPLTYLVFIKQIQRKASYKYMLIILTVGTLLHLSFASTGWFYRYEAYLILCSTMVISILIIKYGKEVLSENMRKARPALLLALFVLSFPLVLRSTAAFSKASQACVNIYEQQYQMATFLKEYYDSSSVAANDIGAITYFTKANNLDLWGLGNIDVAKSKKNKYWTPAFLDSLSKKKDVKIAMVYDSWFNDSLLHRWEKVATWEINDNVICGDDIVSFYAIDKNSVPSLKKNLQDYQHVLPKDVQVMYY
ncbi:MAG TPA: hypothetical protein VN721_17610 [Flavipsychrobacter sp.]|nr:hypothetical protein [Flavipsychrobacter sp.]